MYMKRQKINLFQCGYVQQAYTATYYYYYYYYYYY